MEFKHTPSADLFDLFPDAFMAADICQQGNAMASLGVDLSADVVEVMDAFDEAGTVRRLIACYAVGLSSWIAR